MFFFLGHRCILFTGYGGRCSLDRMVVGFKTTYAISVYHH